MKKSYFLLLILMLSTTISSSANMVTTNEVLSSTMQDKRVSITCENMSLEDILMLISKQTGIGYSYDKSVDATQAIYSLEVADQSIKSVLDQLLMDTPYTYKVSGGDMITIFKQPSNSSDTTTIRNEIVIIPIKGKVTHRKNPLVGATIIKEDGTGTVTDDDGNFILNVQIGTEIEVGYYGMKSRVITITEENDDKMLVIELQEDELAIDDVITTGYVNVRKQGFTGNTVTIKREELLKASKTNVVKALQTFDPSFRMVVNNMWGSDPNALPEMNIRGASSIAKQQATFNADGTVTRNDLSKSNLQDNPNLPTFIMDGFEISATKLYDFDPSRIESITILKDAAATALYGSRASNGVVVITTVQPKAGEVSVQYNYVGTVQAPDLSDYRLLNAADKLEVERLAGYYTWDPALNELEDSYDLAREYNNKRADVLRGVDTDWLALPLQNVFNSKHSLYVDGGSENLRFGLDLNYTDGDGVMKGSGRDNYSAGLYVQYTYKNLAIRNYTSFQQTISTESPYGDFSDYADQQPYDAYEDENGELLRELEWGSGTFNKLNPLYESTLGNFNRSESKEFINNLSINWNITRDLLFKSQFSMTLNNGGRDEFYDPLSLNSRNINIASDDNSQSGTYYLSSSEDISIEFNSILSYNKNINNHMINASAGYEVRESNNDYTSSTYIGFPSGTLSSPQYAAAEYGRTSFSDGRVRSLGGFLSVNYSYKDIYLFDLSSRYEGSSNFGSDKPYGLFWATGFGINIHKYDFMKSVKWVDMLRLRGSYGETGKANFAPYQARTTFEVLTDEWYKTGYGAELKALGNSRLSWERTLTLDVGGEVSLFNDRLYVKATYYEKRTKDLVSSVTLPSSTGFTTYYDNVGETSNIGYELDLRVKAIDTKDVQLVINANLAHNKNTLEKISDSQKAYNLKVQESFDYFNHFTLNNLGLENVVPFLQYEEGGSQTAIYGVKSLGINPATGQDVYVTSLGTLTDKWVASDQVILGDTQPMAQGAFGFSLTYKQFNLYTSFMYEFGGDQFNQTLMDKIENVNIYATNVDERVLSERWSTPNVAAKYKALQYDKTNTYLTKPNSRFVQEYNMLSLSSVELSYDFKTSLIERYKLSMLRLTIGMNDMLYLSNIQQERGLSYPYARVINFSLRASF